VLEVARLFGKAEAIHFVVPPVDRVEHLNDRAAS
jgi:hypothetical protein